MFIVGIDISKFKHDCCIISSGNQKIISKFTFRNNLEGFNQLLSQLNSLDAPSKIKIGFEATGHYAINLKLFLEKNNFSFMEANAYLVSKFSKTISLRKTKTDKIDCELIAKWLLSVEYKPYPLKFYHIYSLKSYTRLRQKLVHQRSVYKIHLTNIMDHIFPEFKPFFKDSFNVTALYILEQHSTPEKISNMSDDDYQEIRKISRGNFERIQFIKLKELASNTVGQADECFVLQLKCILNLFKAVDKEIDNIGEIITKFIEIIKPKCYTIPGIGAITAAIIYTEYGNFDKFDSPAKMLAYAGLDPSLYQSGTALSNGGMVKHGSSYLRDALMKACLPLIENNPTFANYYAKKINEGKAHLVACSHLIKKVLRVIFALEKNNLEYDPVKSI